MSFLKATSSYLDFVCLEIGVAGESPLTKMCKSVNSPWWLCYLSTCYSLTCIMRVCIQGLQSLLKQASQRWQSWELLPPVLSLCRYVRNEATLGLNEMKYNLLTKKINLVLNKFKFSIKNPLNREHSNQRLLEPIRL